MLPKDLAKLANKLLPSTEFANVRKALAADDTTPYPKRLLWNALPYSNYGYGIYHAAVLAQKLEIPAISAIEFGVAGGNGLVAMEAHANAISAELGVKIQCYGFDTGEGLTPPQGYRDMPYRFAAGNYKMDVPLLQSRLKTTKLVLGDVKHTVGDFYRTENPPPIGFVSFDMDYYSSTMDAFRIFGEDQDDRYFLPRMHLYFDDVVGNEDASYNDFIGELAAIHDFNAQNDSVKIAENRVFRALQLNFPWYHQMYLMHRFRHNRYNSYISTAKPTSLSLKDAPATA